MDEQKMSEITSKLQAAKDAGKPFALARQELLDAGYSESQVALTVANNNPYMPKPPVDPMQQVKDYLKDNPQAAEAAGNSLAESVLRQEETKENAEIAKSMLGSHLPGAWGLKYTVSLIEILGWPFLLLLMLEIAIPFVAPASMRAILIPATSAILFLYVLWRVFHKHKI